MYSVLLVYLDPRSHRNARACSLAARLTRSDDLLQQGTRELCALTQSVEQGAEQRALNAIRYGQGTRSGQGALARRHTDGPLRAALLKTTLRCEGLGARSQPPSFLACFFSNESSIRRRVLITLLPVYWYRSNTACHGVWSKAYSGGVLARALPEGLRYLST